MFVFQNHCFRAFTQRASRILESIYETDKKIENDKQKRNKPTGKEVESNSKEEMELGEHINHAGRLLLNHGYIEDAIKTQNRTFLDNKEVRNIINKMWYGLEHRDLKTVRKHILFTMRVNECKIRSIEINGIVLWINLLHYFNYPLILFHVKFHK